MNPEKMNPTPEAKGNQMNIALSDSAVGMTRVPPPFGVTASQPEASQKQEPGSKSTQRPSEAKIIAGSVGLGGKNHPEDVEAVLGRLLAMRIINYREYGMRDEKSLGLYVTRYQGRIFNSYQDGLVEVSGKTEQHLVALDPGRLKAISAERKPVSESVAPINYHQLAAKLRSALEGGVLGWGKEQEAALGAFQAAKPSIGEFEHLRAVYQNKFGKDLVEIVQAAYHQHGGRGRMDWLWNGLALQGKESGSLAEGEMKSQNQPLVTRKTESSYVSDDGWSIPQVLSKGDYFSQLHPKTVSGVTSVPRKVAFGSPLSKYDHGGAMDIYDDAKVKKSWRKKSIFEREKSVYYLACGNTAKYMARQGGYVNSGAAGSLYTLMDTKTGMKKDDGWGTAINRLDEYLEQGIPVVAGVDRGKTGVNSKADGTASPTDHFIVIVGRGMEGDRKFYTFFDPGRGNPQGCDEKHNRLYMGLSNKGKKKEGWISSEGPVYSNHVYALAEIRKMDKL